jgi:hypothetical protein
MYMRNPTPTRLSTAGGQSEEKDENARERTVWKKDNLNLNQSDVYIKMDPWTTMAF